MEISVCLDGVTGRGKPLVFFSTDLSESDSSLLLFKKRECVHRDDIKLEWCCI